MNRTRRIMEEIARMYPDARCELNFKTPYQLLVAVILSAQSTDKRVNIVTESLFKVCPDPESMVSLGEKALKIKIKSIGFYNTKAAHIIQTSQKIISDFDGKIPMSREELMKLPGVGRKTANVVLSEAFGIAAFAVDTHVLRVSRRLNLTSSNDPLEVEKDITSKIPKKLYHNAHHAMIFHGRRRCKALKPLCDTCTLCSDCNFFKKADSL